MSSTDRSRPRPGQPGADAATAPTARRQPDRPRVTVERVDTEALTVDQHRDAVAALAALIDRWTRPGENTIHDEVRVEVDSADPSDIHGPDVSCSEAA